MKDKIHYTIKDNSISHLASSHIQLLRDNKSKPVALSIENRNSTFDHLFGMDFIINDSIFGTLINHKSLQGEANWLALFDSFSHNNAFDFFELTVSINALTYPLLVIVTQIDEFDLYVYDTSNENKQYTNLNKILSISEEFLQFNEPIINYQKIVDDFLIFCSGQYAVFNLFDQSGTSFKTKAITGDKGLIQKISRLLGYNLIEKEWPFDPVYFDRINQSNITYFNNLYDIIGNAIPKPIIFILDNLLNIGEIVVIKIMINDKILGEFTVFMDKKTKFIDQSAANLYTKQVGLLITRFDLEKEIKKEQNFLKTTLLSIADGVISTNLLGEIILVNKAAETLIGLPFKEINGSNIDTIYKTFDEHSSLEKRNIIYDVLEKRITIDDDSSTYLLAFNGLNHPIEQSASPLLDDQGKLIGAVLVFRDVYDKKKKQSEINYLSFYDQLTGLYNRRFYEEELLRLDHERNLPLGIIIGDINGLKLINDSFGHASGDQLIIKAAESIKKGIRASDIAARLGGDEFIILLPSTNNEQVEEVIKRMSKLAINERIESTTLSISFGHAIKTHKNEDMKDIIKVAEDLMYKHKLNHGSSIRHHNIDLIMESLYDKNERELKHTHRVSELCGLIAKELGYDNGHVQQIKLAGLLHDIGKIGIDETILNKIGRLNKDEWSQNERHAEIGYRILSSVNDFAEVANYVLEHHEKFDGKGYPRGLSGSKISKQARIIAIADSYDAMTSEKNYGTVLSTEEAVSELKHCADSQFDPEIVRVFVEKVLKKTW